MKRQIVKYWWAMFIFAVAGNGLRELGFNPGFAIAADVFDLLALVWLVVIVISLIERAVKRPKNNPTATPPEKK